MERRENLIPPFEAFSHANVDQLAELTEICDLQVDLYGYGGQKTATVLDRYLFSMSCYARPEEPFMYKQSVINVLRDEATRFMFEQYYPGATEDDLESLVRLDAGTFARVSNARAFFVDYGHQYTTSYDYKEFQDFVLGTPDGLQMYPHRRVEQGDNDISTVVAKRITDGMPRPLQLLLATKTIAGLSDIHRQYHGPVFKNVIEGFDLSNQELRTTVALAGRIDNLSARSIANFVVGDSALLKKFCDDSGNIDYDALGGTEVMTAMLVSAFCDRTEFWLQITANIPPSTLEEFLPYQTRRGIVLASITKSPHLPQGHLAEYVPSGEIAQITRDYIVESLESELPEYGWHKKRLSYSPAHAAIEFGIDDVPFRLKELDRYRKLITVLEQSAPKDSELDIQAQVWRGRIDNIDPWLDAWLESYAQEKRNPDHDPLPVVGWTGDPSEEEYIQSWATSRQRSLDAIERIKTEVTEYLNKQKSVSTH